MSGSPPGPEPVRTNQGVPLLGKPVLTTPDAVAQALALGPLASIGLVGSLVAKAGSATPFALIVVFLGSLALGWVVSLYARRYAGAGVLYEYIMRVNRKTSGVFFSLLYFSLTPLGTTALLLATGALVQDAMVRHLGVDPGWWSGAVITGLVAAGLVFFGVRLAVRTQLILTVLSAIPFVVFAVVVIAKGGASGNTLRVFAPGAPGQGDLFQGLLFALFMFSGFESAACLGEEMRLPHRSIPRAILWTLGIVGVFYLFVIYAATIGFGPANVAQTWGKDPTALWAMADRYAGPPLGALMEFGVVIDVFVVSIGFVNSSSRGLFSLARDGLIPRRIARTSRHDTPVGGILTLMVPSALGLLFAIPLEHKFELFETIFEAGGMILPVVFIVLVAGAVRLVREQSGAPWRWPVLFAAAGVPALGFYGAVVPFPTAGERKAVWLAITVYLLVGGWTLFLSSRRSETVESAVRHVLEPEASA